MNKTIFKTYNNNFKNNNYKNNNYKNNNYNHVIKNLQDYMLTNKNISNLLDIKVSVSNNNTNNKVNSDIKQIDKIQINNNDFSIESTLKKLMCPMKISVNIDKNDNDVSIKDKHIQSSVTTIIEKKINSNNVFFPKQKDTLFWCFYIMKNDFESYEMLNKINIVIEKKEKISFVEKIRENKKTIKGFKLAPIVNMENSLVNESTIDINTFWALCIIEKLHVIYIHKKTYLEFKLESDDNNDDENYENIHVLTRFDNPLKYGYQRNMTKEKINEIRNTLVKLDNLNKPIKAFSSYKTKDLLDLCTKLGLEVNDPTTNKKKTNKELYESIVQYF